MDANLMGSIGSVAAAIIALITVVVSARQTKKSIKLAEESLKSEQEYEKQGVDRERKQATIEAYNTLYAEALLPLDQQLPKNIKQASIDWDKQKRKGCITDDPKFDAYRYNEQYVTKINAFCIGIENNIYDKDVAVCLCKSFFENRMVSRICAFINSNPSRQASYKPLTDFINGNGLDKYCEE